MRCAYCKKWIPDNSQFCLHCGKPVSVPEGNYETKKCALCHGRGRKQGIISSPVCEACNGQGSVLVVQPAKKCALCRGSGVKMGVWSSSPCAACGGSGWANAFIQRR